MARPRLATRTERLAEIERLASRVLDALAYARSGGDEHDRRSRDGRRLNPRRQAEQALVDFARGIANATLAAVEAQRRRR